MTRRRARLSPLSAWRHRVRNMACTIGNVIDLPFDWPVTVPPRIRAASSVKSGPSLVSPGDCRTGLLKSEAARHAQGRGGRARRGARRSRLQPGDENKMMGLVDKQLLMLSSKLSPKYVKSRRDSNGNTLFYVEGWHVITESDLRLRRLGSAELIDRVPVAGCSAPATARVLVHRSGAGHGARRLRHRLARGVRLRPRGRGYTGAAHESAISLVVVTKQVVHDEPADR